MANDHYINEFETEQEAQQAQEQEYQESMRQQEHEQYLKVLAKGE